MITAVSMETLTRPDPGESPLSWPAIHRLVVITGDVVPGGMGWVVH